MKPGSLLMAGLVLATVAGALGANMWKRDLTVREVRTEGNRIVTANEILALAAIPKQQRLFDVDLRAARRRVETNQFIRSASVNRDVPDRISISVVERTPVAAIAGDRMLYVDEEGMVLPPARSEFIYDLPVLTGALAQAECAPGKKFSSDYMREALQVLVVARSAGDDLYGLISEVHVDPEKNLTLYTSESGVPVAFGRGDAVNKMMKLDAFWKEFVSQRGAQELQYIDLRFEDQVVVRWHESNQAALAN